MLKIESRSVLSVPCRRWEAGLAGNPNKPCLSPEKYAGKIDFDEYTFLGAKLLIPSFYLFGTQRMNEYDPRKRRKVETNFTTCGVYCLHEHPVPVCILPGDSVSTLAIIDAHHRTRYSGKFRINPIPSIVFTPSQLVDLFNQYKVYNSPIDETSLVADLEIAIGETLASFGGSLPNHKYPRTTPVHDLNELKSMFSSF